MARFARVVVPEVPHHVTARGNRREPIFFEDGDQDVYCDMLAAQTRKAGVDVWAYCLMPNHVHLILTPWDDVGLGRAIGECHRRYTAFVNARARWSGHLFDGRFASVAMDEAHLMAAVRYVSLNPVRAGFTRNAEDWAWSSVRAHRAGVDDGLVVVRPVLDRIDDLAALLSLDPETENSYAGPLQALRASERTGRPLGPRDFVNDLERRLGRPLARRGAGRRSSAAAPDQATLL